MNFLKIYKIQSLSFFYFLFFSFFVNNITVIYSQDLQPIPELKERITDLSGILSIEEKQELAAKLKAHEEQTTNQIAILIVPTTSPEAIEQYSIRVVEKWKLGKKGKNNGILLLFAMQDRKMRIEVGYGLEGVLPDAKASRIIREVIVPKFKERKFYEGIDSGVNAIIDVLSKGDFEPPPKKKENNSPTTTTSTQEPDEFDKAASYAFVFFFVTYIAFLFIANLFSIQGFLLSTVLYALISLAGGYFLKNWNVALVFTAINVVIFILLELIRRFSSSSDSGGSYYYTGGSSYGSSYSSYSSSGGDSFSGGGGDFGGGGASGSWD